MKCDICGADADSGSIITGQGFTCSKDCEQIAVSRRNQFHAALLAEPVGQMPDNLETHDFERWSLKFALHFLDKLSQSDRVKLSTSNPILLIPEHLALDFKERILNHLHKAYVSEIEFHGHQRMFCSGEYCFRQPVPAEKIVEAARKAQLIT